MRVVVEEITDQKVRGWAFDPESTPERVQINGRIRGGIVFETTADLFRKDLLDHHIGDGCHGFEIALTSTMLTDIDSDISNFVIYGNNVISGDETAAEYLCVFPKSLKQNITKQEKNATRRFVGESYFLDTMAASVLRQFTSGRDLNESNVSITFSCRKTCSFGDYLWWDDSQPRNPSAARLFEHLSPVDRDMIETGRMMLIFDMSSEGPPASRYSFWLDLLHGELSKQKIRPESCILVNQNRYFEFDYRQWCRASSIVSRMHIFTYDYFISKMANLLDDAPFGPLTSLPSEAAWKHFLCLNFTPRSERVAFVSWLFGNELHSRGHISFAGFQNAKADGRELTIPDWFPEKVLADTGMEKLRASGALLLDLADQSQSAVPEFSLGPMQQISESFFTIVTESDFSPGDIIRVTEKIIKPLAYGHPFVVVGNPDSLRVIRNLGFRTFSPWIDETYDGIDDPATRMARVQGEIHRLCSLSYEEMVAFRSNLNDVIEFNFLHARRGLASAYRDHIGVDLLRNIMRATATARPVS